MRQKLILSIGILAIFISLCFGAWDNDKPADSDAWNNAAGFIRDNNDALEAALGVDLSLDGITLGDITTGDITADDVLSKGPFVDIRAHGAATSASAATNATAIQAALDSLTSGGAILVPAGTFQYDTTLTLLTNTGIVGTGPGSSILKFTATDSTNAVEITGTGIDLSTGTPLRFCWMREVGIEGNASSGHGIFLNIAKFCTFINVHSNSHGGDCYHIGSAPVASNYLSTMGRIAMINCHSSGGVNSVFASGGDIYIGGKCGFNGASGIGIILEDMRITYLNGISGGSANGAFTHGIEIRSATGHDTQEHDLANIHLNDIHWEQLTTGNSFINVSLGGTTELIGLSITDCEYSPRAANGITLVGVVKNVYIDRNHIISRRTIDAAIGIDIGASCENIYVTDRNFWPTNINIDNAAGVNVLHFQERRNRSTTIANTSGSSATNIMSVTITASYLETRGGLMIKAAGTKTGGNNTKTLKLLFGAKSITFHDAQNNTNDWRLEATIINTATNAQKITWVAWDGATVEQGYDTASIDTTSAVTLAIEGTCVNASDNISHEYSLVERF